MILFILSKFALSVITSLHHPWTVRKHHIEFYLFDAKGTQFAQLHSNIRVSSNDRQKSFRASVLEQEED